MFDRILVLIVILVLLSCDKIVREDEGLIMELFNKSVDTLIIGENRFVLDAFLWRDFQPMSPQNGKPLISINRLVDVDSLDIPDNIDLKKQYVIHNNLIWIAEYTDEEHYTPSNMLKRVSRNGPKWGPDEFVDIVTIVNDSHRNLNYYLRVEDVYINKTY